MPARRFGYIPGKITVQIGGVPLTGFEVNDLTWKTATITEKFAVVLVGDRVVRCLTHSEYIAMIYNRLEPYGA